MLVLNSEQRASLESNLSLEKGRFVPGYASHQEHHKLNGAGGLK